MAARTYSERVIVLRKTRLREADLILTMLAADGRQVRAVAKGALKPTGSFASRLELFAESDVLLVEGKSLDIVKEARLVDAHVPLRFDYERSVAAAPMAELLAHATQDELPVPRLFDMTQAALACLERVDVANTRLVAVAFLLKAASVLGFRPSLAQCAECGDVRPVGVQWFFSHAVGGVLCPECAAAMGESPVPAALIDWADALIRSTFADIAAMRVDDATQAALIRFTGDWVQAHICHLKSIHFLK